LLKTPPQVSQGDAAEAYSLSDLLILQALMGQRQGSGPFVDPYLYGTLLAQLQ